MTTENAVPTEEQCDYSERNISGDAVRCARRQGHSGGHTPVWNGSEAER